MFSESIGLLPEHIRFRQHQEHQMAHYARECWDLEVNSSYGWVECAGLADRSCFDLQNHSLKSKKELVARENFAEVRVGPSPPLFGGAERLVSVEKWG